MQPYYTMTQAIGETYKQTGGRSMPMQPYLIEGLAEIYVTPTPRVFGRWPVY